MPNRLVSMDLYERDMKEIVNTLADIREKLASISHPTSLASDRNQNHQHPDQDENQTRLSPSSETHQHRDSYNHGKACHRIPETSRYIASGNSPNTSVPVRISFHQTSILRESYGQLLSQILSSVLAQHGSSNLTDELFQVLFPSHDQLLRKFW